MMTTRVTRYGNSLAVRLPAALAKELEMREGDRVTMRRVGSGLVIEREYRPSLEEMLALVREPEGEWLTGEVGAEVVD